MSLHLRFRHNKMKKPNRPFFLRFFLLTFCMLFHIQMSYGQAAISLKGGNPTISLTTGTAGGQLLSVVNTTSSLAYKVAKTEVRKITVVTSCPGQRYSLSVLATSVSQGVAAPEVTLINGNPAIDFITNAPAKNGNGTATLQYTASATFAQGNSTELGDDVHTITYTIQAQ